MVRILVALTWLFAFSASPIASELEGDYLYKVSAVRAAFQMQTRKPLLLQRDSRAAPIFHFIFVR